MQGITGKLSGKMGAAVFRVREGQQVVTQYNPIVKNPNTGRQQIQRAKFKLMSQLGAIMAPAMGSFIIKTRKERGKPSQRNAFTQINMPLVEVSSENQIVTARIPMDQIKLTSSFRSLPSMTVVKKTNNSFSLSMEEIPRDVTTLRVVILSYPLSNNTTQVQISSISDFPVLSQTVARDINVPKEGNYTVLAFGLIPSESAKALIDLDNIHTPGDEDFVSAVDLNAMVAAGDMIETVTVGANIDMTA